MTVAPAEHDLVSQGLPVVQAVSRRLARRLGGHVHHDDLAGIGNLALVEIARSYDPTRASFTAYATARVRWAILDGVRRETHVRAAASRAAAILASERYAEALAEEPQPDEPTTLEEDQAALASLLQGHAAALALGLTAGLPDPALAVTPEEAVERAELAHVIKGVIGDLPDRERALMERHYFGGEAFDSIADELGISKSWASRLHERAIRAVQRAMGGAEDEPPPRPEPSYAGAATAPEPHAPADP
jgi:RNA polymerase sigma factor for flagellar operon FliA